MTTSEIKKSAKLILAQKYLQTLIATFLFTIIVLGLDALINFGDAYTQNAPLLNYSYKAVYMLIYVPLTYGLISLFLDYSRNKDVKSTDFINMSLHNFSKLWAVVLRIALKLVIAILIGTLIGAAIVSLFSSSIEITDSSSPAYQALAISFFLIVSVATFIVFLPYSMSLYILADDPTKKSKDIIDESSKMLEGQKANLILLYLSFIGWIFVISSIAAGLTYATHNEMIKNLVLMVGTILLSPYMMLSTATFYDSIKEEAKNNKKHKQNVSEDR